MKIQPVNVTTNKYLANKKTQYQNTLNSKNISFNGNRAGLKLYGGFAGVMSTVAGVCISGFSSLALLIGLSGAMLGGLWGAMLDSKAQAKKQH